MQNNYSISSYDKHLSLKVNSVMWLILLYLLRPYVVAILSLVNMKDRMQLINMFYSDALMLSLGAFAGIPAALLIYAWTRRTPGASSLVRRLWKRGRTLLAISAVLNACIVFAPLWLGTSHKITVYGWVQLLVSLLVVFVLYKSRYIKDCFSDFPSHKSA